VKKKGKKEEENGGREKKKKKTKRQGRKEKKNPAEQQRGMGLRKKTSLGKRQPALDLASFFHLHRSRSFFKLKPKQVGKKGKQS
jgi:hypothetical protein